MKRVLVIGCSGSGKSTLARQLGARLGLPITHLDHLFWRPGWISAPPEEFEAAQAAVTAGERWVIDGNYSSTLHLRLPRADTVVFLDLPRRTSMRRVLVRTLREAGKDTQAPGCMSKVDREFLEFVLTWRRKRRARILARLAAEGAHTRQFLLGGPRDVAAFLRSDVPQVILG